MEETKAAALKQCKKLGLKGKELYVKNELYKSLRKSGENAKKKDPKKKGKKKK